MYCPQWWLCPSSPGPWSRGEEWGKGLSEALKLGSAELRTVHLRDSCHQSLSSEGGQELLGSGRG